MLQRLQYPIWALLLALLAAPALAQTEWPAKMCTAGYEEPAFLLSTEKGFELHVGSTVEQLLYEGSVGTGLNGAVIRSEKTDNTDVMFSIEMWMDANVEPEVTVPIRIFRDRVFWPCGGNGGK